MGKYNLLANNIVATKFAVKRYYLFMFFLFVNCLEGQKSCG